MICPSCQSQNDTVADSRPQPDGTVHRRRRCLDCQHRWSTVELTADAHQALERGYETHQIRRLDREGVLLVIERLKDLLK